MLRKGVLILLFVVAGFGGYAIGVVSTLDTTALVEDARLLELAGYHCEAADRWSAELMPPILALIRAHHRQEYASLEPRAENPCVAAYAIGSPFQGLARLRANSETGNIERVDFYDMMDTELLTGGGPSYSLRFFRVGDGILTTWGQVAAAVLAPLRGSPKGLDLGVSRADLLTLKPQ